jgi:transposase
VGFRKHKVAVKMHTLLDLHGNIPTFIRITDGKVHDVNILDEIIPEAGAST